MHRNQGTEQEVVSSEAFEVEYVHRQFPNNSHEEVVHAIEQLQRTLSAFRGGSGSCRITEDEGAYHPTDYQAKDRDTGADE
jgi:hypothetical protein